MTIRWVILAIMVMLLLSAMYSLAQSLRAEPPRKGRAVWEAMWVVLLALVVLWNLRVLGLVQVPFP